LGADLLDVGTNVRLLALRKGVIDAFHYPELLDCPIEAVTFIYEVSRQI